MKKVGKIARPFRYDLNQIPYDYTVEVRNRFKGLDLINKVPDELWNEVIPEWSSGFPYFLQFESEFGNKEFMI